MAPYTHHGRLDWPIIPTMGGYIHPWEAIYPIYTPWEAIYPYIHTLGDYIPLYTPLGGYIPLYTPLGIPRL